MGTSIYVWHDGHRLFDEVIWDPADRTRKEAVILAIKQISSDLRATVVQVEYGEEGDVETVRRNRQ